MAEPEDSLAIRILELERKRENYLFLLNEPNIPESDKEKIRPLLSEVEAELLRILEGNAGKP